ncbi:hypothetical protein VPNG_02931 [Cytospora leucostoma]|uniref:Uncharacterized protein n=1 Tax=Cytospora leucostoma TaxID=1230097 RepID=A0A423XFU4_9PEZI|nr:hypothetical protein VPNG_02931 [Cytospora leucostoma]
MGRRPNQVIQQYFQRGPKLADNSNRYPQTCKLCGENFPKGRIDSLTTHLTKRCPAISEQDRINACLMLNGISAARTPRTLQARQQQQMQQPQSPHVDLNLMQPHQNWTPLETLAEVSRRQIDHLNEHGDERVHAHHTQNEPFPGALALAASPGLDRVEAQEQFTVEDHTSTYHHQPEGTPGQSAPVNAQFAFWQQKFDSPTVKNEPEAEPNSEERMRVSLEAATSSTDAPNLSVAAAAAARLNNAMLDPTLFLNHNLGEDLARAIETVQDTAPDSAAVPAPAPTSAPAPVSTPVSAAPEDHPCFGSIRTAQDRDILGRDLTSNEEERFSKFARSVLSPRIWRSGCVRTKFTDELNLYNAGVQIVHSQKHINGFKSTLNLEHPRVVLEASHFPGEGPSIAVEALRATKPKEPGVELLEGEERWSTPQVVMIDDQEEISGKLEAYVRELLPEFARKEKANFSRITVETAIQIARDTDDRNLKLALELWGFVEVIDRELKWHLDVRPSPITRVAGRTITQEAEPELYKTICLQLTAAAERKASTTSKNLLTHMQRDLQDARVKIGHGMFFTVLVLLICVEKSTWAFKAWEEMSKTISCWPLGRPPSYYTQQGYRISELLGMLLGIRRALPKTAIRESDGILVGEDSDPILQSYFERVNLKAADIVAQQQNPQFSPLDSRTLELHFCSNLLLPFQDAPPGHPHEQASGTPEMNGMSEPNYESSHGSNQEQIQESIPMVSEATEISANPESPGMTGS